MNILVLSSFYPEPDDEPEFGVTPVVSDFCQNWVKSGHNVVVIHNTWIYNKLLYLFPLKFRLKLSELLQIKIGSYSQLRKLYTVSNGVQIFRLPQSPPKSNPRNIKESSIQLSKEIKILLENMNFSPTLIIGHWTMPQLPLLCELKRTYCCKVALTFHGMNYLYDPKISEFLQSCIEEVDAVGVRSNAILRNIATITKRTDVFLCPSGIDLDLSFCREDAVKKYSEMNKQIRFIFVGRLIKRKNLHCFLISLKKAFPCGGYKLDIIGVGPEQVKIKRAIRELELDEFVYMHGLLPHQTVRSYMKNAHCLVMASKDEPFGLVYLEAMDSYCTVIASKNEGIDGIVRDGYNGFLVEAGNINDLQQTLIKYSNLDPRQILQIVSNAHKTVEQMSKAKMAQRYLESIINTYSHKEPLGNCMGDSMNTDPLD